MQKLDITQPENPVFRETKKSEDLSAAGKQYVAHAGVLAVLHSAYKASQSGSSMDLITADATATKEILQRQKMWELLLQAYK